MGCTSSKSVLSKVRDDHVAEQTLQNSIGSHTTVAHGDGMQTVADSNVNSIESKENENSSPINGASGTPLESHTEAPLHSKNGLNSKHDHPDSAVTSNSVKPLTATMDHNSGYLSSKKHKDEDVVKFPSELKNATTVPFDSHQAQEVLTERPSEILSNGAVYTGQWKGQYRHGYGQIAFAGGESYEGQWVDGHACGEGKFYLSPQEYFIGNWENDHPNGYGEYCYPDGSLYKGQWKMGLKHGKGEEKWANGSIFTGTFVSNYKSGYGSFSWPNNSKYEGELKDNEIHGKGRYIWADGRSYVGNWKNGSFHGEGTFTWQNGRSYHGQYVDGEKEGTGTFIWPDGTKYVGRWKLGQQSGKGLMYLNDTTRREGLWKEGQLVRWLGETIVGRPDEPVLAESNEDSEFSDVFPEASERFPYAPGHEEVSYGILTGASP